MEKICCLRNMVIIYGSEQICYFQFIKKASCERCTGFFGGVVDVYVNTEKPKDTFMDASSCVLKLKG